MGRRRDLFPGLGGESTATIGEILEHLKLWRSETLETIDLLGAHRQQVDGHTALLENPRAVLEYLDFFVDHFRRVVAELDRIGSELAQGVGPEHGAALRQIASNASAEQRRCLLFRDKIINKPLPYEQMRSLLNQISIDTRDQLLDYQDLTVAAARLDALGGAPPAEPEGPEISFDRRALFRRFLPRRE